MPFYGEVWRQTTTPVLWIQGVHEISCLKIRDLRPKSDVPLLTRNFSEDERLALLYEATTNPKEFEKPPDILFDSSDEEFDGEDEAVSADVQRAEIANVDCDASESGDEIRGETDDEFDHNEMQGEQIKEQVELLERRLIHLISTLQEVKKYLSAHRHLREIPNLQGSVDIVLAWSERRERIRNARALPTTFGAGRRGNVFM